MFLFTVIWAEAIAIFINYNSLGQLLFKAYGVNGLAFYFLAIFALMFTLSGKAKKISDLAGTIVYNNPNIK